MPVNGAGISYGGFQQPTVGVNPRATQFTNQFGELMNDEGSHPQTAYGALVDPNSDASKAYNFLGREDRGAAVANQYRGLGAQAGSAPQADLSGDVAARNTQLGLASAYRDRFEGRGPSLAGYAQTRGTDAAAGQAAMARMGAGAGAQRQGLLRGNAVAGTAAQGAAQMRSDEVFGAGSAYGGLVNGMRQADTAAAMRQSGINLQQRALDDSRQGDYEDLALGVEKMGMTGARGRADGINAVHDIGVKRVDRINAGNADRNARDNRTAAGFVYGSIPVIGSMLPRE